jgi:hypothetical protein
MDLRKNGLRVLDWIHLAPVGRPTGTVTFRFEVVRVIYLEDTLTI